MQQFKTHSGYGHRWGLNLAFYRPLGGLLDSTALLFPSQRSGLASTVCLVKHLRVKPLAASGPVNSSPVETCSPLLAFSNASSGAAERRGQMGIPLDSSWVARLTSCNTGAAWGRLDFYIRKIFPISISLLNIRSLSLSHLFLYFAIRVPSFCSPPP